MRQYWVLLLLLVFSACENDLQQVHELTKEYEAAVETGKNIEMLYSEEGSDRVKIEAPTLKRHKTEKPFVEFPDGLKVTFYNSKQEINSVLTADYAIRYEQDQRAILERNVVLVNEDKDEMLETEELFWDEKNRKIYGEQLVTITTPREKIIGKSGFEADQDFSEYTIKEIVDSRVLVDDKYESR